MKFLVIGLGSMGKRRIRCLKNLGYNEIYGFDIKSNRIDECKKKYKIYSLPSYRTFLRKKYFDAVFVCTDPLFHFKYSICSLERFKNFTNLSQTLTPVTE
jgi:predicted dehydrogenase